MLKSVAGTNQYLAMRVTFLAQGNNTSLWLGFKSTTDLFTSMTCHPLHHAHHYLLHI